MRVFTVGLSFRDESDDAPAARTSEAREKPSRPRAAGDIHCVRAVQTADVSVGYGNVHVLCRIVRVMDPHGHERARTHRPSVWTPDRSMVVILAVCDVGKGNAAPVSASRIRSFC